MSAGKRRYVHIGYPKSASTTIQNTFLCNHPSLYHLGNGWQGRNNTYADDGIEWVAETVLRYRKDFLYDPVATREAFLPHFETAEKDDKYKAVGLSSEFLCFTLSQEIDVTTKAKRLHDIFGDNTCVIFVFREQFSLLKSLYLEMIRGGYYGSFKKFIEYTYLFQDRNWCRDFCYDKIFETYAALFGKENVCAVPFEIIKESQSEFTTMICKGIGVEPLEKELPSLNQGRDDKGFYEYLRRFNEKAPHEFGSAFYEPFSSMRMRTWFHNELGVAIPGDRLADDAMRMPIGQTARQLQDRNPLPDIEQKYPKAIEERLEAIYAPSNKRLAELTGLDLAKYKYRMG